LHCEYCACYASPPTTAAQRHRKFNCGIRSSSERLQNALIRGSYVLHDDYPLDVS
jgi:hypothetical protein